MIVALIAAAVLPQHHIRCAHALDEPRPALTRAHQAETVAIIRDVVSAAGGSDEFATVLRVVAARESSLQRGLVHRLDADLTGSSAAWTRLAPLYAGNPAAGDAARWQTYGLFGMNSAIFTMAWNRLADPRVLCDAVVDVLVYRRAAERVRRRAGQTVPCKDGSTHLLQGTWTEIHGAVSGGSLCPRPADDDFRWRARRAGVDPDTVPPLRAFGSEPVDQARFVVDFWARWAGGGSSP